MIKQLTRHGNSWALVIDRPVLELLKIEPEKTALEVTTDGQALIISPATSAKRGKQFRDALERTNRKYGRALKKLAE